MEAFPFLPAQHLRLSADALAKRLLVPFPQKAFGKALAQRGEPVWTLSIKALDVGEPPAGPDLLTWFRLCCTVRRLLALVTKP